MDLNWLEDFLSLARTGNFSHSAVERNITQSAFSRRIKALEAWLGVPLVDRSTYPTRLTSAGRTFRDTAEEILRQLYEERSQLRHHQRHARDVLSFAAQHTISLAFYPKWLRNLERTLGPIESRLVADNMHDCVRALIEGNCDFLLCFAHPALPILVDTARYPYGVVSQDRLIPVSAPTANKQPRFRLPGTKQAFIPYLSYAPDSYLGNAVDVMLGEQTQKHFLRRCYENSLAEGLKAMALESHGLAWLPESSITNELKRKRLVRGGGVSWDVPLEVRLYRSLERSRPRVEELWGLFGSEH